MNEVNWKDAAVRALKTGVAAFVAAVPVAELFNADLAAEKAGLIIAGAAVVTYVWNVLLDWQRK